VNPVLSVVLRTLGIGALVAGGLAVARGPLAGRSPLARWLPAAGVGAVRSR